MKLNMFKISEIDKAQLQQLAKSTNDMTDDLIRRLLMNYDMMEHKLEQLEKALDRIGVYCAGSEFNHVSDFILRVKSGEEKSL